MRNHYPELDSRYDKLGPVVVKALEKRHFWATYVKTKEEACQLALSLIPQDHTISWGGTMTMQEVGLMDAVKEKGFKIIDRDQAKNPEERIELMRQGLLADTFLASANAISEDGQLVNLDGNGNRVAAMIYGPKQVIIVAGMNKVAKDLDAAIHRVRNVAAPARSQSFPDNAVPCMITGTCSDCLSPDSICAYLSVIRLCRPAEKVKVILVGEDLGL